MNLNHSSKQQYSHYSPDIVPKGIIRILKSNNKTLNDVYYEKKT